MPIPDWTATGILPPIPEGVAGHSPDRSPYRVGLVEVAERFVFSPERAAIFRGFLGYREALRRLGLVNGFQWLNGSFMEHVEETEGRAPRDIDVVTFFELPVGVVSQADLPLSEETGLMDAKRAYRVDAYLLELGQPMDAVRTRQVAYWNSMWSHRRDRVWKGYLEVDLEPKQDAEAGTRLDTIEQEGFPQ